MCWKTCRFIVYSERCVVLFFAEFSTVLNRVNRCEMSCFLFIPMRRRAWHALDFSLHNFNAMQNKCQVSGPIIYDPMQRKWVSLQRTVVLMQGQCTAARPVRRSGKFCNLFNRCMCLRYIRTTHYSDVNYVPQYSVANNEASNTSLSIPTNFILRSLALLSICKPEKKRKKV